MKGVSRSVALLRGINVSGKNKLRMSELKKMMTDIGFDHVETYVQSGNIVFDHRSSVDELRLESMVKTGIRNQFGYEVSVIVLGKELIQVAYSSNPFITTQVDQSKLYLTVVEKQIDSSPLDTMKQLQFQPDQFLMKGRFVYVYCPNGYGRTKLNNQFFEKKLQSIATTRNWKTVTALWQMTNLK